METHHERSFYRKANSPSDVASNIAALKLMLMVWFLYIRAKAKAKIIFALIFVAP